MDGCSPNQEGDEEEEEEADDEQDEDQGPHPTPPPFTHTHTLIYHGGVCWLIQPMRRRVTRRKM